MPLIRCPQCNLAITDNEARGGACPACAALLPREAPVETKPAPPEPVRTSRPIFWAVIGTSAAWIFIAAAWFILRVPSDPPAPHGEVTRISEQEGPNQSAPTPRVKEVIPDPKPPLAEPLAKKDPPPEAKEAPAKLPIPPPVKIAKVDNQEEPKKISEPKPADPKPMPDAKPPAKNPVQAKPAPLAPAPKVVRRHRFTPIPYLHSDNVKIDGELAEWTDVPPILLNLIERGRPAVKPVIVPEAQRGYIAYCSKGIVIAVDVIDTSGALENHPKPEKGTWSFWDNDAVEIFIETLNRRTEERGEPSAHQFFAFPFGTQDGDKIGGYESKILRGKSRRPEWSIVVVPSGNETMLRGGRKNLTGWTMEILLPKSILRQGEFKPGINMGFELQIDTGTNAYYFWACNDPAAHVSMRPDQWGEILFAGSDAKIDFLDADGKPAKSFVPGKPLTVRVTDADVSLDPALRDKLSVTLRSRGGDVKTVPLKETKIDSGVFVGTIATRLATGKNADDVFEVAEGESIVAEYVDRLRANGDRDFTVRTSFAVRK